MIYGRYKKPHENWSNWLEFSSHDDALRHCGWMARGREIEILSEADHNLRYGEKPSPGVYERLVGKLEESRNIEDFEGSEDAGNLEEDDPQDIESPEQGSQEEQRENRGPGRQG